MENNETPKPAEKAPETRENREVKRHVYKKHFMNKRKVCRLCADHIDHVDYKQIQIVKMYCTDTGRILPRKVTGACSKHQRQIARAIKINRNLAILPYSG